MSVKYLLNKYFCYDATETNEENDRIYRNMEQMIKVYLRCKFNYYKGH